jgi:hypothetical protein
MVTGRSAGHVPRLGARAFATALVFPFVLAAASAAMIAAGAATSKSRIPSGPYMPGAATAVILASPDLVASRAMDGINAPHQWSGLGSVHRPARMAAISWRA